MNLADHSDEFKSAVRARDARITNAIDALYRVCLDTGTWRPMEQEILEAQRLHRRVLQLDRFDKETARIVAGGQP